MYKFMVAAIAIFAMLTATPVLAGNAPAANTIRAPDVGPIVKPATGVAATTAAVANLKPPTTDPTAAVPDVKPLATAPAGQPAPHSWSGCYLGMVGGDVFGTSQHVAVNVPANPANDGLPITDKFKQNGATGGGIAGCNYEINHWVGGIEGDYSWAAASGNASDQAPFDQAATSETSQQWLGTVRGRIGFGWDLGLVYATAGAAFAGTAATICNTVVMLCASESQTRTGWVAGAGVEYAFWQNLSLKIEYLHADLGTGRYFSTPVALGAGAVVTRDVPLNDNIFRAGLNWRFVALPELP